MSSNIPHARISAYLEDINGVITGGCNITDGSGIMHSPHIYEK
jgi:hypothetical protein